MIVHNLIYITRVKVTHSWILACSFALLLPLRLQSCRRSQLLYMHFLMRRSPEFLVLGAVALALSRSTPTGAVNVPGPAPSVAVVGAGAQGVVAALELNDRGFNVTLFDKAPIILPIVDSIELHGFVYEYLSQLLLGGATTQGFGPPATVVALARRYQQPLEPFPASANPLFYDSSTGLNSLPSFWLPYLATPAGQQNLLQQLAAGFAILQQLDAVNPTPAGVLGLGIVASANQTFGDWAAQAKLPAFTGLLESFIDSALSGPASASPATLVLQGANLYALGPLRQAFLLLGELTLEDLW